ncbi:MAG: cofactor-independent phosphoglycerate mutase [Deltaproteobacteria bacterium]|jgi:2,3-bisphosphoglycerate-independent phosphoglycerate mutase|nr:cofactor-independent phosphoglycerate mutase [Deltaproteobacteria bacterium]
MKYIILIGDGMGDYPLDALGGQTPLMAAQTPNLDRLAKIGRLGRVTTTPKGMAPGSDVAIMSLLGYNPQGVLTGRGPLEAAALNVPVPPGSLAFRVNLVTLERGATVYMRDHSAGDISNAEAGELIQTLATQLPLGARSLHQGVSYRHLLVWPDAPQGIASIPPHDYRDKAIDGFLNDLQLGPLMDLVKASWPILEASPVNQRRLAQGLPPANSIWLWGQGQAPKIRPYQERWGLTGGTVSAVDIIRGLGLYAGLKPYLTPGATGLLNTNYQGKAETGLQVLKNGDVAVIHLEAPDECSHQGDLKAKIQAIENFDRLIVGPVVEGCQQFGDHRILVACDHFTPISLKTHSADPVPFALYDSQNPANANAEGFSEKSALATGFLVQDGPSLGQLLFGPERSA